MFVQGFGDVLTNVMTVNPALSDIPSASSILDTSNYTFQAVTFGKDAEGFTLHAHEVSTTQYVNDVVASGASAYDSGLLIVKNYGSILADGASSYVLSATYNQLSSTYNSVPNDTSPLDYRLERASTLSTNLSNYQYASSLPNLGHYINAALNPDLSAIWNKVGAFTPSAGSDYRFFDKDGTYSFSGTITSFFNANQLMDKDGYLHVGETVATNSPVYTDGAALVSSTTYPITEGQLALNVNIDGDDAATLVAFGSVKHLGVYCLDLNQMLESGLTPPYGWSALNNNRKYKLVAKVTILDNPLHHRDGSGSSGFEVHRKNNPTLLTLSLDFK